MPFLILVIAGVIFLWGRQSDELQLEEVGAAVAALCEEAIASPQDGPLPPRATEMRVRRSVFVRLQEVLVDPGINIDAVSISVDPGDTAPPIGDGKATHHAVIQVHGRPRIGLRLVHPGDAARIEVLGYWMVDSPSRRVIE